MQNVLIIGDGSFAREVESYISICDKNGDFERKINAIGFAGKDNEDFAFSERDHYSSFFNGIGNQNRKQILAKFVERTKSYEWPALIVGRSLENLGYTTGLIVAPNATVSVNCRIGDFCIVNYNASVGHDCEIGDYVTICPNVSIGGWCKLGNESYIGAGANILPKIKIGERSIIGAGAVVTKDVPDGVIAKGVPAKW